MSAMILLTSFILSLVSVPEGVHPINPAGCSSGAISDCVCPPKFAEYAGPDCMPPFQGQISPLSMVYRTMMEGRSFHDGCPLALDDLRLLTFTHWGYGGLIYDGQLVVAAEVADEVLQIMRELYLARFPIQQARLIDNYQGDDGLSMADNNSSAFNCRKVNGSEKWSEHSFGQAIDINPLQNPFVTKRGVEPPSGRAFVNRQMSAVGLIKEQDPVVKIFAKHGWKWGGRWQKSKDYQHFSKSGR